MSYPPQPSPDEQPHGPPNPPQYQQHPQYPQNPPGPQYQQYQYQHQQPQPGTQYQQYQQHQQYQQQQQQPGPGHRPGPQYQYPVPPHQAPQKSGSQRTGLVVLGIVCSVVVLVLLVGVGWYFMPRGTVTHSPVEAADPLKIDEPRTPPKGDPPSGGPKIQALEGAAMAEAMDCTRVAGEDGGVLLSCAGTDPEPWPHTKLLEAQAAKGKLVSFQLKMEADPVWGELVAEDRAGPQPPTTASGVNLQPDGNSLLRKFAASVFAADELAGIDGTLSRAGDGAWHYVKTSLGELSLRTTSGVSEMALRPADGGAGVSFHSGLRYLTPKQLKQVAGQHSLSCDRGEESLTCTAGDIEMVASFPAPKNQVDDHVITEIKIETSDGADDPRFTELASAVTAEVVGKVDDPEDAASWVQQCFSDITEVAAFGANLLTCSPSIEGTLDDPETTGHTFVIGKPYGNIDI